MSNEIAGRPIITASQRSNLSLFLYFLLLIYNAMPNHKSKCDVSVTTLTTHEYQWSNTTRTLSAEVGYSWLGCFYGILLMLELHWNI